MLPSSRVYHLLKAGATAGDANCVSLESRHNLKSQQSSDEGLSLWETAAQKEAWTDGDTTRGQDGLSRPGKNRFTHVSPEPEERESLAA